MNKKRKQKSKKNYNKNLYSILCEGETERKALQYIISLVYNCKTYTSNKSFSKVFHDSILHNKEFDKICKTGLPKFCDNYLFIDCDKVDQKDIDEIRLSNKFKVIYFYPCFEIILLPLVNNFKEITTAWRFCNKQDELLKQISLLYKNYDKKNKIDSAIKILCKFLVNLPKKEKDEIIKKWENSLAEMYKNKITNFYVVVKEIKKHN